MGRFSSCPPSYLFALPRRTAVSSSHVSLPPPPLHHAIKLYVSLPGPLPQPPPFKQPSYTHCDAIFCRTGLPRASPVDPPEPAQAATDGTTIRVYLTSHFWAKLPKYRIRQHN